MNNNVLSLLGRSKYLFDQDLTNNRKMLESEVQNSRFLVLGGAGSIGQAVTKEIFKRNPLKLYVVDINENNMVELVRDIRSSYGYIDGDFRTFILDVGSLEYDAFFNTNSQYDYILNLSALKHVRSEKDPFTLMRMINVNILNTEKTLQQAIKGGVKKYFCVSTDKAANPVNLMGASKLIMEMFLMRKSLEINISTARFANVAFSDGSLLHGFNQRIDKGHPIVVPKDVKRYFISPQEAGELCLMSCIFGENRDIFFPKLSEEFCLTSFSEIATRYLSQKGFMPYFCNSEEDARKKADTLIPEGKWPCLFTISDTTGEKYFEEFYTSEETINFERFESLGIIKNDPEFNSKKLLEFEKNINLLKQRLLWDKDDLTKLFHNLIPNFNHIETGKYLDDKM